MVMNENVWVGVETVTQFGGPKPKKSYLVKVHIRPPGNTLQAPHQGNDTGKWWPTLNHYFKSKKVAESFAKMMLDKLS